MKSEQREMPEGNKRQYADIVRSMSSIKLDGIKERGGDGALREKWQALASLLEPARSQRSVERVLSQILDYNHPISEQAIEEQQRIWDEGYGLACQFYEVDVEKAQ